MASAFLHAVGTGSRVAVSPATVFYPTYSGAPISSVSAIDMAGNLYLSETYPVYQLFKVDHTTGAVTLVAGGGSQTGEGIPANRAQLSGLGEVALDPAGNIYIVQGFNGAGSAIRRIDAITGLLTTVAGNGQAGYSGDGGPASSASVWPRSLAIDTFGNMHFSDWNNVVRKVSVATGNISTIAGTGAAGFSGDDGLATAAQLNGPAGLALDAANNLYIADSGNNRVREIAAATGIISTIAGTGGGGYSGDGGNPVAAQFDQPIGLTVDPGGGIYVSDSVNSAFRRINGAHDTITTVAAFGEWPGTMVSDSSGNIFVQLLEGNAEISTVARPFQFPDQFAGEASSPQTFVVTNSGNAALNISAVSFSGENSSDFRQTNACGSSVAAGGMCTISVVFDPSGLSSRDTILTIADNAPASPQVIPLSGTGISALTFSPPSYFYYFPESYIESTVSGTFVLANTSPASVDLGSIIISGSNAADFTQTNNCRSSLAAGAVCQITVTFAPTATGRRSANLIAVYDGTVSTTTPLEGFGTQPPVAVVSSQNILWFSEQETLTMGAPQTISLTNFMTAAARIQSLEISGANAGDFSARTDCESPLAVGATCHVFVSFMPTIAGYRTASLTISGASSPIVITLTGSATFQPASQGSSPSPEHFEIVNSATGKVLDIDGGSGTSGTAVQQNALNGSREQQWRFEAVGSDSTSRVYKIVNVQSGKVLDVTGQSTSDGALIQEWDYLGGANQQWDLIPVDDVHYKILNVGSGKVLDVPGASTSNGTQLQQWDFLGNPQQLWVLLPSVSYDITNVLGANALDIAGGSASDGTAIQQNTLSGTREQQWQFLPVAGGYYAILNRLTGKVLDVAEQSMSDGALVQEWDYLGGMNQQWRLQPVSVVSRPGDFLLAPSSNVTFEIVNRLSGKAMDDIAMSTASGAGVQQWDYLGGQNQQWRIAPVQYFNIINLLSGAALDVPGGLALDGTDIQQWMPNGFEQQAWQLVPAGSDTQSGAPYYAITNELTGKALEVNGSTADGALVQESTYTASSEQQWELLPAENGYNRIANVNGGKVLDVLGLSKENGAQIQQWDYLGGQNQQWSLIATTY